MGKAGCNFTQIKKLIARRYGAGTKGDDIRGEKKNAYGTAFLVSSGWTAGNLDEG